MTAKHRRRKLARIFKRKAVEYDYWFVKNNRVVVISAASISEARMTFRENHGYWPDKELNHGHPKADPTQARTP